MRGIRRIKGVAQREAQALQRDDLFLVLERMGDCPIDIRDKALLLIGFAAAFAARKWSGYTAMISSISGKGSCCISAGRKPIKTGKAARSPHGRTRWCPVRHLTDWLAHARIENRPIFRSIDRHGHIASNRLSGKAVATITKRRVEAAGFDPAVFSGHSLRAGFATSAVMAGASTFKIRAQTGHKSDAMLGRYVVTETCSSTTPLERCFERQTLTTAGDG